MRRRDLLATSAGMAVTGPILGGSEREVATETQLEGTDEAVRGDATDEAVPVVDFNWAYPDCPDRGVSDLGRYFTGDVGPGNDEFHVNTGDGAEESTPTECVLRTDADDATIVSLPDGTSEQEAVLDRYPSRGDLITFEHYVHRADTSMEFRFGVQPDEGSYYAVHLETEGTMFGSPETSLYLLRVDAGDAEIIARDEDVDYRTQEYFECSVQWGGEAADDIGILLESNGTGTRLRATDGTFDEGGIAFHKRGTGLRPRTNLWSRVDVE